jgi:protein CpxP
MSPKSLFALSVASLGLVLSQVSLRADDTVQPPPPGVDTPPPPPPGGHGHGREGFRLAELTAKLGLTPDEVKVIEPIIESGRSQGKAIHEDDSLSPQDKRAKMKAVMESTRSQIRAALTADQQKIFDTLPVRGGGKRQGGASEPGTPPAPPPTTT